MQHFSLEGNQRASKRAVILTKLVSRWWRMQWVLLTCESGIIWNCESLQFLLWIGGMVCWRKTAWTSGFACMCGARICACFCRYIRKESPAHQPLTLMTSNGIFQSKYSSVAPMHMPWPFKGRRSAAVMAVSRTFRNFKLSRASLAGHLVTYLVLWLVA